MRRPFVLLVAAAPLALLVTQAQAKQVVPMHEQTVTRQISATVHAVTVNGDFSAITVTAGRASEVRAHEAWNFTQPVLSVSVSKGTLKVSIRCKDTTEVAGVVTVDGLVNDCTDDLTLTVPAGAALQTSSEQGATSVTGMSNGVSATVGSGNISLRHVGGSSVRASSGQGKVLAQGVRARAVDLHSDAGDVTASDLVATSSAQLSSGQGAVTLNRVRSASMTAHSDAGAVHVESVKGGRSDFSSGQGAVSAQGVDGSALMLESDAGDVQASSVTARTVELSSGQGSVTADDITASTASLRSDAGDVTAKTVRAVSLGLTSGQGAVTATKIRASRLKAHSDAGDVSVATLTQPRDVNASSGQGKVTLDVVRGTYDVVATSGQGQVTVTGLVIYSLAHQHLAAHSDAGDVTVRGH